MTRPRNRVRQIYVEDNLEVLARVEQGSVALAYFTILHSSRAALLRCLCRSARTLGQSGESEAFDDRWAWHEGIEATLKSMGRLVPHGLAELTNDLVKNLGRTSLSAYVVWIAPRLYQTFETLSKEGSLYIHCDPSSSHYIKLILDNIFGQSNFRNEIVWRRTHAHSSSHRFGPVHDVILFYSKGAGYIWNTLHTKYEASYITNHFVHKDERGKYQLITCTAPGDRTGTKAHYNWRGKLPPPGRHWAWKREQMEEFEAAGRMVYSSNGIPRLKRYVDDGPGVALQDIWTDISRLDAHSAERIGYETQKPVALLERIIATSSRPGDLVIDPFCGSGTTLVAAERLGRDWIGIDSSLLAGSLALGRTRSEVGIKPIRLSGFPNKTSLAVDLMRNTPLGFGVWGASLLATLPERRLVSDALLVGTGWVSVNHRKLPLVSLVPLTSKIPQNISDLPIGRGGQVGLIVNVPQADKGLRKLAAKCIGKRVVEVSLSSMTSTESLTCGMVEEVLHIANGAQV